jgi:hypothetical protein
MVDPCRLVRQVKEIEWLDARFARHSQDPCRLARQVTEIWWLQRGNLIHLPGEPAGADTEPSGECFRTHQIIINRGVP